MSEQDSNITPNEDEDVDAHGKKRVMASDEAPRDDESEDDVELHGRRKVQ